MKTIRCKGKLMEFGTPKIAGILNITPDSFYDGGNYTDEKAIVKHTEEMISEGADMIDIGAVSSRPGAEHISEETELKRLIPALRSIRKSFPDIIISLDTFRSKTAEIAVRDFEVDIINDITGGNADEMMFETLAELHVPYIMMHMRGMPRDMQNHTKYDDIIKEIIMYFVQKISKAKNAGINDIIVDPGFGFSKTIDQNFLLLKELKKFKILDSPLLVGISRKSMIYKALKMSAENVLPATTALHAYALLNGADILRVHDVKEAVQAVKMFLKLYAL